MTDAAAAPDRLATSIPTITFGEIEMICWVADDESRYEWRGANGRIRAGRVLGSGLKWSMLDDKLVGKEFKQLRDAVLAAERRMTR